MLGAATLAVVGTEGLEPSMSCPTEGAHLRPSTVFDLVDPLPSSQVGELSEQGVRRRARQRRIVLRTPDWNDLLDCSTQGGEIVRQIGDMHARNHRSHAARNIDPTGRRRNSVTHGDD